MQKPTQTSQTLLERWENQKNLRENQKYQRQPKKTITTLGKTKQKVVKSFRLTLGYGFVFCFVGFPEGFLQNQQNLRENQKYTRKPKKTPKTLGQNQNNKVFKGFRLTLGYGFVFLFWGVFPKVFTKPTNPSRKPKIQKKTNKSFGKTKKTKQTYPRVGLKPLTTLCFGFVLMCLLVFFGFLWYFWLSRRICWFCKNHRENQQNKKQTHFQGWVWNL